MSYIHIHRYSICCCQRSLKGLRRCAQRFVGNKHYIKTKHRPTGLYKSNPCLSYHAIQNSASKQSEIVFLLSHTFCTGTSTNNNRVLSKALKRKQAQCLVSSHCRELWWPLPPHIYWHFGKLINVRTPLPDTDCNEDKEIVHHSKCIISGWKGVYCRGTGLQTTQVDSIVCHSRQRRTQVMTLAHLQHIRLAPNEDYMSILHWAH